MQKVFNADKISRRENNLRISDTEQFFLPTSYCDSSDIEPSRWVAKRCSNLRESFQGNLFVIFSMIFSRACDATRDN